MLVCVIKIHNIVSLAAALSGSLKLCLFILADIKSHASGSQGYLFNCSYLPSPH